MDYIDALSSQYQSYTSSTSSDKQIDVLGKDDFFQMMIAQLKYQDPLNPLDGTEFTAQLAQFSSLEQMTNINTQMETLTEAQMESNKVLSVSLVGKEVTADGNTLQVEGDSLDVMYSLSEDAVAGIVKIYQDGSLKTILDFNNQQAGNNSIIWDCSDVEKGLYTYEVEAKNASGDSVEVQTKISGQVTGVAFEDGSGNIMIGDIEVPFEKITAISKGQSF